jgi:hypothetical protein
MKAPVHLRIITEEEFHNLKQGDVVYLKICGHTFQTTVVNKPFWNSDADEPDWEVETTDGFSDMYSLYVKSEI